jgi:hypothetical protein
MLRRWATRGLVGATVAVLVVDTATHQRMVRNMRCVGFTIATVYDYKVVLLPIVAPTPAAGSLVGSLVGRLVGWE